MMGEETSPAALPETRTSPLHAPPSEPPVSVEPDNETIRRLLAAVTEASTQPADPRAREELLRHARILEQISNPEEVARMAEAIRNAFDAREFSGRATSRPAAGSVDFDQCVVADVTRVEDGDTVTIRETLTDPSGLDVLLLTSRTIDPRTGEATYRQELMEPGREPTVLSATQEEFDSASARYAPFELMNRFPLVRQLHRQAVVPLLGKFANSRPSKTPPTSLPATTSTTD